MEPLVLDHLQNQQWEPSFLTTLKSPPKSGSDLWLGVHLHGSTCIKGRFQKKVMLKEEWFLIRVVFCQWLHTSTSMRSGGFQNVYVSPTCWSKHTKGSNAKFSMQSTGWNIVLISVKSVSLCRRFNSFILIHVMTVASVQITNHTVSGRWNYNDVGKL